MRGPDGVVLVGIQMSGLAQNGRSPTVDGNWPKSWSWSRSCTNAGTVGVPPLPTVTSDDDWLRLLSKSQASTVTT